MQYLRVVNLTLRQLYIAGESYAGQHIPYIARAILKRNKDATKNPWKLAGLLIGNGWISPADHYLSYLPFAYEHNLIQGGSDMAKRIESQQSICVKRRHAEMREDNDGHS